ncbi:MAG TPA: D-alanyl-D-alanine carboxypeptidase/D-alanyl-D-alanine-endopeptidase [Solirubrobacteraceae bacterium]|nr:D-alanyl-D-alanine carboxypeptidase/D-alanyl-D-alanine-endopeptidase [Solirubrobacteraceae bacterium]
MRRVFALLAAASMVSPAAANAAATPQRTLTRALNSGITAAGRSSGADVVDLTTGQQLYSYKSTVGRLPASVEKLYTTATALIRFGPDGTFQTRVYATGALDSTGTWHGTLYLRGGGDPTFGARGFDRYYYGAGATMQRLVANLLRTTPIKALVGQIVGDEHYFDSVRGTVATSYAPSGFLEGLLSGLAYDRGFTNVTESTFQSRPALFAAQQFAAALRAAHVRIAKSTRISAGATPAGAASLTSVHSPRMATLLRLTNTPSDNFFAEMLIKDIGAQFGSGGTTAAGAAVVRAQVASSFGVDPRLDDGSGLSYNDSTSPQQVVTLLSKMHNNTVFYNSLAIAGETGTLANEMNGTVAEGRCHGKTGTLQAVSNLVGYCTARDGHTLAFAFLMNAIDPNSAHPIQDRMAVALANYDG